MAKSRFPFLHVLGAGAAIAVTVAVINMAGCDGPKPDFMNNPMAPAGSTPDQIRAFCTDVGDQAASWLQNSRDPIGSRLRASNEAFAACMARHNIRP